MAKRLHALPAKKIAGFVALWLVVLLASCDRAKPQTPPFVQAPAVVTESIVQGKPMQIIGLEEVEGAPIANVLTHLGIPGIAEMNSFVVGFDYVSVYDETRNAFVLKYKLLQPEARIRGPTTDYYLVGDRLYQYGDMVGPNTSIAIYPLSGVYYSVYLDRKADNYYVVSSADLINWGLTGISTKVPILLYRMESDLFAIADDKVFRVQSESLVREIPGPKDDANAHWYYYLNAKDWAIFYSYSFDHVVAVHHRRDFEDGQGEYFLTINLNDFTYKRNRSDKTIKIGEYFYKAVKRADGWKVYYIAMHPENGVKVLDPLADGGPLIVETLPGVVAQ